MKSIIIEVQIKSTGLVIVGLTPKGEVTYNGLSSSCVNAEFIREVNEALEQERKTLKVA